MPEKDKADIAICGSAIRIYWLLTAILLMNALLGAAEARPPEIRNVNVRGFQIGQPTIITIDGAELLPSPKLWLNQQAIDAVVDDKQSSATRAVLTVTLPDQTPVNFAALRLATAEGFSNAVVVALDRMPQLPLTESVSTLPVCLHGIVSGSSTTKTSFAGKAGDDIMIEVEAKRLGSKLRPVVHLYDTQRLQIAWAMPIRALGGDCRLSVKLPRDGQYTVEIHDLQYAAQNPSHFRLKLGQWQYADAAFPAVVTRGQDTAVQLIGNLASSNLPFKAPAFGEVAALPIGSTPVTSGLLPSVGLSALPEWVETSGAVANLQASSTGETPISVMPIAINGRLDARGQLDQYRFAVTPGAKLSFEVFADRLGSPIDAVLELRNKDGGVIATNDDGPTTLDPRLDFVVPAGMEFVTAVLRDSLDVGGSQAIYRLVVTGSEQPQPEVIVIAKSDVANVSSGAVQVMEINVARKNYDGPLKLELGPIPAGVNVTGTEIPAGSSGTLLVFSGTGDVAGAVVTAMTALAPDGRVGAKVRIDAAADDRTPLWLRESFSIAATPKVAGAFEVDWADAVAQMHWVLAEKSVVPVKFVRPSGFVGPIRLTLISSQLEPRVNNQPNPAQSVRPERVVEVPLDPPIKAAMDALTAIAKQVSDAQKLASASQGDAKTAADAKVAELVVKQTAAEAALKETESKANSKSELALIIPSNLSDRSVDVAIKAELLNPEKNVVLRSAYSPIRRLPVLNPITVKLAGSTTIEQKADPKLGTTIAITGKIERLAGFKGDVSVQIIGVPAGTVVTNANVKSDQTEFSASIKLPANTALGEVKGIKLALIGPPDPMTGNQPIRNEIELLVKLVE